MYRVVWNMMEWIETPLIKMSLEKLSSSYVKKNSEWDLIINFKRKLLGFGTIADKWPSKDGMDRIITVGNGNLSTLAQTCVCTRDSRNWTQEKQHLWHGNHLTIRYPRSAEASLQVDMKSTLLFTILRRVPWGSFKFTWFLLPVKPNLSPQVSAILPFPRPL